MPNRLYVCTPVNADAAGVVPCGLDIELLLILPL
jgi:hypothetical protein